MMITWYDQLIHVLLHMNSCECDDQMDAIYIEAHKIIFLLLFLFKVVLSVYPIILSYEAKLFPFEKCAILP